MAFSENYLELPLKFEDIYTHINSQINNYDEIKGTKSHILNSSEVFDTISKSKEKMQVQLGLSEDMTLNKYKSCEKVNDWFSILKTQRSAYMDQEEEDSNEEANSFMLAFKKSSTDLKSLQKDLVAYLRDLVVKTESPLSIRLIQLNEFSSSELERRQLVLAEISKSILAAQKAYSISNKENAKLIDDMNRSQQQLDSFTDKNSYTIVQNAKKSKIIVEDWKEEKRKKICKIQKLKDDIEMFVNREKGSTSLLKQVTKNDDEIQKLIVQYNEQMRLYSEEIAITDRTHQAMMNQLQKELAKTRSVLLKKEASLTKSKLRDLKSSSERELNKMKKEIQASTKKLESELKRKSGNKQNDKPDMGDVYKTLSDDHEDTLNLFNKIMKEQLDELSEINKQKFEYLKVDAERKAEKIAEENDEKKTMLESRKQRVKQQLIEREIENSSIMQRLSVSEGIMKDIFDSISTEQERNDKLHSMVNNKKSLVSEKEEINRKEIEVIDAFVSNANIIVDALKKILNRKMNEDFNHKLIQNKHKRAHSFDYYEARKLISQNKVQKRHKKEEEEEENEDSSNTENRIENQENEYKEIIIDDNEDNDEEETNESTKTINENKISKKESKKERVNQEKIKRKEQNKEKIENDIHKEDNQEQNTLNENKEQNTLSENKEIFRDKNTENVDIIDNTVNKENNEDMDKGNIDNKESKEEEIEEKEERRIKEEGLNKEIENREKIADQIINKDKSTDKINETIDKNNEKENKLLLSKEQNQISTESKFSKEKETQKAPEYQKEAIKEKEWHDDEEEDEESEERVKNKQKLSRKVSKNEQSSKGEVKTFGEINKKITNKITPITKTREISIQEKEEKKIKEERNKEAEALKQKRAAEVAEISKIAALGEFKLFDVGEDNKPVKSKKQTKYHHQNKSMKQNTFQNKKQNEKEIIAMEDEEDIKEKEEEETINTEISDNTFRIEKEEVENVIFKVPHEPFNEIRRSTRSNKNSKQSKKIEYRTQEYGEDYIPTIEHIAMTGISPDPEDDENMPLVKSKMKEEVKSKPFDERLNDSTKISIPIVPKKQKKRIKLIRKKNRGTKFNEDEIRRVKEEREHKLNSLVEIELGLEPLYKPKKRRITIRNVSKETRKNERKLNTQNISQQITQAMSNNKYKLKTKYSIRRWYGPHEDY